VRKLLGHYLLQRDRHPSVSAQLVCKEREDGFDPERAKHPEKDSAGSGQSLQSREQKTMKKKKITAGESMIVGARQALAFARGEPDHGCIVHIPEEIDVKAIWKKVNMSQEEFARQFGFSKRTLEHWEHGRRVPTGPARAFLTVIAREPDAVRRALMEQPAP
jgi:putative transcriptional regulator